MLAENQNAQTLHNQGMKAFGDGDYNGAIKYCSNAIEALAGSDQTVASHIQAAQITRDVGLAHLHLAAPGGPQALEQMQAANVHLNSAHRMTADLLSTPSEKGSEIHANHDKILVQHGFTLSYLGRMVTLKAYITQGAADSYSPGRAYYEKAHLHLSEGGGHGNGLVGNAMAAARHELLANDRFGAARWVGRAAVALARTATSDHANPKYAAATFATFKSGMRQLYPFNRTAAEHSVQTNP